MARTAELWLRSVLPWTRSAAAIRPGEFFSLLGPSGSGKTTTLMMVAGFVAPDGGAIRSDGIDITRTPAQRRWVQPGVVFQNYAIFPHLNVFENVAFPPSAVRKSHDGAELLPRVQAALELVRLERFARRFARQLSGGQQQRVAIAWRLSCTSSTSKLMD